MQIDFVQSFRPLTPIWGSFRTVSFVIIHFATSSREGRSNITSRMIPSIIERSPRAPVLRSIAFLAISTNASSSNSNSTSSSSNNF